MKTSDPVFELFLNYACQAKCAFCYNPPITDELLRRELSFAQAAAALYSAAKTGAKSLNMHGGEVTLRDDLTKIVRLAKKVGFEQITLVTNGVKLGDGRYARSLVTAGVTHVRMSLHAPDAETHDKIVVVPGAFDKALNGVGHLRKHGIPVGLNYVLVKENVNVLPDFVRRFMIDDIFDDLIVYFPHERGMMELNAKRIGVTYNAARSPLLKAAAMLDAAGKRLSMLIANVPPCALPELAELLLDWELDQNDSESTMMGPEGGKTSLHAMKDGQKRYVAACKVCALRDSCRGIEPEYTKRHGDNEFRHLAAVPPALAAVSR